MKTFEIGDRFLGVNYADMVSQIMGRTYNFYLQAGVNLENYGVSDLIAWFVYMDGSEHGYEDGWKWSNVISLDGEYIAEVNVSPNKLELKNKRLKGEYAPYRLAFQRDPDGNNHPYECEFKGVYVVDKMFGADNLNMKYKRIMDKFTIGSYKSVVKDVKDELISGNTKLQESVDALNFSPATLEKIKKANIKYVYELFDLKFEYPGELAREIQKKLGSYFNS